LQLRRLKISVTSLILLFIRQMFSMKGSESEMSTTLEILLLLKFKVFNLAVR
jgi:hypothetical protein